MLVASVDELAFSGFAAEVTTTPYFFLFFFFYVIIPKTAKSAYINIRGYAGGRSSACSERGPRGYGCDGNRGFIKAYIIFSSMDLIKFGM